MTELYIGLENTWPISRSLEPFINGSHYNRLGSSVFFHRTLKPGSYKNGIHLITHHKISNNWDKSYINQVYPELDDWIKDQWPRQVGRYRYDLYLIDVVFGQELPEFTPEERTEWLNGLCGYWPYWTYDLKSYSLATLSIGLVKGIDDQYKAVRHLTSLINEKNSADGILHGMWDSSQFHLGVDPSKWQSTCQLIETRLQTGKPVKFAQCWIFSEVLVSIFRYLGIPARTLFIENALIDHGDDGGIDLGLSSLKGDGPDCNLDLYQLLSDSFKLLGSHDVIIDKDDDDQSPIVEIPLPNKSFNLEDLLVDGDGAWNFHVMPEVYIARPDLNLGPCWNILDGCPLKKTTIKDQYHGQYLVGPCPSSYIKDNIVGVSDSDYFISTINGVYRYWRQQIVQLLDQAPTKVIFPYKIVKNLDNVIVNTRDLVKSNQKGSTVKKNLSQSYHSSKISYHGHPIVFDSKLNITVNSSVKSEYFVQVCLVSPGYSLISFDRQVCKDLDTYVNKIKPLNGYIVSIVIVDLISKKWWSQVV